MSRVWGSRAVPLVALVAMLGSLAWMLAQGAGGGSWGHGVRSSGVHGQMMGGTGGGEPVASLTGARDAAAVFADRLEAGATVGEVMQFDDGYYAEIVGADGALATEVLVDPATGAVSLEYGPARMWNTRYGMMPTGTPPEPQVSVTQAEQIADRWLGARGDLVAGDAEAFPGYYTLHTLRDGHVVGMLSVHATTGDVWPHTWHGEFVDMTDAP